MPCDHCGGRSRIKRACYTHHRAVEVRYLCGPCRGEPRIAPTVKDIPREPRWRKRRRDPSRWDAVKHLLGTIKDEEIATMLLMSRNSVCNKRNKMGIPRFDPRAVTND